MGIRVKEKVVIVVIVVFNWKQQGQQEPLGDVGDAFIAFAEKEHYYLCKIHGEFMGIRVKE